MIAGDACFDQPPLRPVEFIVVTAFQLRHADQLAFVGKYPGVEGAGEFARIAIVVATDPHPPMAAIVQEHMQLAMPITVEDDRFFAHPAEHVIARFGNMAFMADKQPGAREYTLQLIIVDSLAGKNLPADHSLVEIDHAPRIAPRAISAHCGASLSHSRSGTLGMHPCRGKRCRALYGWTA